MTENVTTHRTAAGVWEDCGSPDDCDAPFHFPGMSVEQMQAIPFELLLPLFEASDPAAEDDGEEKTWRNAQGELHRENDLPAVVTADGSRYMWARNGELHRDGGPAVIYGDGEQRWFQHGKLHRLDGPAVIDIEYGAMEWYVNGERESINDQPSLVYENGVKYWHKGGRLHRVGGPAVVYPEGRGDWYHEGLMVDPSGIIIEIPLS